MSSADPGYRRGLASCLGGMGAVLLGIAFEEAAPVFGVPGLGGALGLIGLVVAISGALAGAFGVVQMERSAGPPPA